MGSASRPGPVKAALAGAPKGSLDGWPRCSMISERGNGRLFAHIRRKFQLCPNRKFLLCGDNSWCRRKVEMSYSRKVEMSYWPRFANSPFPSSENVFRTARSCQGRVVLARRSEPLTASTVLDNGHRGKGGCRSELLCLRNRTFLLCADTARLF